MHLLDANACIHLINGTSPPLIARFSRQTPSNIHISSVVKTELLYGARNSTGMAENLRVVRRFTAPFVSLPFDDSCAQHYPDIRLALKRVGKPIGPNDLMIAATALAHDLILVTHNVREFERVPGLVIEDWEDGG